MFGLASGFYQNYMIPPEVSCLILGLDSSGKTTLLERLKVTDFGGAKESTGKRIVIQKIKNTPTENRLKNHCGNARSFSVANENFTNKQTSRRKLFACPAPGSYRQLSSDSEEEADIAIKERSAGIASDSDESICRIEVPSGHGTASPIVHRMEMPPTKQKDKVDGIKQFTRADIDNKEYDLRPGKNPFPPHLIRPTIGMNLGKVEACNAKVKMMDLGGSIKMRPLWERYYSNVHAVTFVIDVSPSCEVSKLMEARAFYRCMRDDESLKNVPILIFANKIDLRQATNEDATYSTESEGLFLGKTSLLDIAELFLSPPRGAMTAHNLTKHDNLDINEKISMFAGSAKTGEGVRAAFEWVIRAGAKRAVEIKKEEI